MIHTEHKGLEAIKKWLVQIYGNNPCFYDKKFYWIWDTAVAMVEGTKLPAIPKEGNTNRDWRAAQSRIDTIKRILEAAA